MNSTAPRYDRWKAPAQDGQTLIWPAPGALLEHARQNQALLDSANSVLLQNVPLPEVRKRMREWVGHSDDSPIVATGHQTELHHPGVWVKNILIDVAAAKLGGRAIHFAVDTDAPKHLSLRWPGGALPLTDDDRRGLDWSGLLQSPTPAHIQHLHDGFEAASANWNFRPLVPVFLASMRRLSIETPNLAGALTNSLHELDWSLGLRHHAMLTSPICLSEPYLVFVHHVLARAEAFAADYNAALDDYRQENRIRTPGRPMPNLTCSADGCEVPFWLDDLVAGIRTRAAVIRDDSGGYSLRIPSGERFHFDPRTDGWDAAGKLMLFLRRTGMRLAPRALTLTAVLRLLIADQFVHGIGGGQYDQVLDKLIARHLRLEPPRFSITTATLFFPEAVGRPRVCLPCIAMEGHRLKHSILGQEKMRIIQAIEAVPRRTSQRASLFYQMHQMLAEAAFRPEIRKWEDEFELAKKRELEERVLFDRELFYAIQPKERLVGMIEHYREQFAR